MGDNFNGGNQAQMSLMPPAITDWLPQDHIVWFVIEIVGTNGDFFVVEGSGSNSRILKFAAEIYF